MGRQPDGLLPEQNCYGPKGDGDRTLRGLRQTPTFQAHQGLRPLSVDKSQRLGAHLELANQPFR